MSNKFTRLLKKSLAKMRSAITRIDDELTELRKESGIQDQIDYIQLLERRDRLLNRARRIELQLKSLTLATGREVQEVKAGAKVKLKHAGKVTEVMIVDKVESLLTNCISVHSPLGRALLGKRPGDRLHISTPLGQKEYQVVNIVS